MEPVGGTGSLVSLYSAFFYQGELFAKRRPSVSLFGSEHRETKETKSGEYSKLIISHSDPINETEHVFDKSFHI